MFRLIRRKKLFPGVTLTMSKTGLGFRFGIKGLGLTIRPFGKGRGIRYTLGIPGTGVYITHHEGLNALLRRFRGR